MNTQNSEIKPFSFSIFYYKKKRTFNHFDYIQLCWVCCLWVYACRWDTFKLIMSILKSNESDGDFHLLSSIITARHYTG